MRCERTREASEGERWRRRSCGREPEGDEERRNEERGRGREGRGTKRKRGRIPWVASGVMRSRGGAEVWGRGAPCSARSVCETRRCDEAGEVENGRKGGEGERRGGGRVCVAHVASWGCSERVGRRSGRVSGEQRSRVEGTEGSNWGARQRTGTHVARVLGVLARMRGSQKPSGGRKKAWPGGLAPSLEKVGGGGKGGRGRNSAAPAERGAGRGGCVSHGGDGRGKTGQNREKWGRRTPACNAKAHWERAGSRAATCTGTRRFARGRLRQRKHRAPPAPSGGVWAAGMK